jgi:hypothetical protein
MRTSIATVCLSGTLNEQLDAIAAAHSVELRQPACRNKLIQIKATLARMKRPLGINKRGHRKCHRVKWSIWLGP